MKIWVCLAMSGETIFKEDSQGWAQTRGWELLVHIAEIKQSTTPFEWELVSNTKVIDYTYMLQEYAKNGEVRLSAIRQVASHITEEEAQELIAPLTHKNAKALWNILVKGRRVPGPIWHFTGTVNPLVIAINHSDEREHGECLDCWPSTIQSLLTARCDPNAQGSSPTLPLCQAIRYHDCQAAATLLQHRANPNLREDKGSLPIFWAIRIASAELVQLLLDYRADPLATELVTVEEHQEVVLASQRTDIPADWQATDLGTHAGADCMVMCTTLDAAAALPHLRQILLGAWSAPHNVD